MTGSWFLDHLWLVPLLPFLGALLIALVLRPLTSPSVCSGAAIAAVGGSAFVGWGAAFAYFGRHAHDTLIPWQTTWLAFTPRFPGNVGVIADDLSMLLVLVVTGRTMMVEGFLSDLASHDLAIFNRYDHVLRGLPEVHTDRLSITGCGSNLHFFTPDSYLFHARHVARHHPQQQLPDSVQPEPGLSQPSPPPRQADLPGEARKRAMCPAEGSFSSPAAWQDGHDGIAASAVLINTSWTSPQLEHR